MDKLFIEGGSNSFSTIQKMNDTRFCTTHKPGPGPIRMRVEGQKDIYLTLKPGSYAWRQSIGNYPMKRIPNYNPF